MYDTIHDEILPLPDGVMVYPGHGAGSLCGKVLAPCVHRPSASSATTTRPCSRSNGRRSWPSPSPDCRNSRQRRPIKAMNRRGPRVLGEITPRPITIEEAIGYFQNGAALLDLRGADEFRANHIP